MRLPVGTRLSAKAILFDMDGTLVDSRAAVERVWRRWATRHQVDLNELMRVSHGMRTLETVQMFVGDDVDAIVEAETLANEELAESDGIRAVSGAIALLQSLPCDRWAVVTSAHRALALSRLNLAGLPIPRVLVTAEDVNAGKPNPEGFVQAATQLGYLPVDSLVIEDAWPGLLAGHAAGSRVVALATTLTREELADEDWVPDLSALILHAIAEDANLILTVQAID